jgi:hypothetical protein
LEKRIAFIFRVENPRARNQRERVALMEIFASGSYGTQEFSHNSEQKRPPLGSVVSQLNEVQIIITYSSTSIILLS